MSCTACIKKFKTSVEYELDGHQLECVSCVKDLGVTVSCDLSWSKHIAVIVAKANKTLGLIKRMFKNSNDPEV